MNRLLEGDSLELLDTLDENSVDSCCTDPPYHLTSIVKRFGNTSLDREGTNEARARDRADGMARFSRGFMGKQWDGGDIAFRPEFWTKVYRVLKPGAHLLAFSGTRTYHRMACAIEDAGFEVRDQIGWAYGCLDEATEVATPDGVKPYRKIIEGDLVICYDLNDGSYSTQPVLEVVAYDYDDTAFRLIGDFGEQVVSRNHRCIIKRGGAEVFQLAEEAARERKTSLPVLEDLRDLQSALRNAYERTSSAEFDVLPQLQRSGDRGKGKRTPFSVRPPRRSLLRRLWRRQAYPDGLAQESSAADVLAALQRCFARKGVGSSRPQRTWKLVGSIKEGDCREDDRPNESIMERRFDLPKSQRRLREPVNKIRALLSRIFRDGAQRRLCDGVQVSRRQGDRTCVSQNGSRPSQEPRCNRQYDNEPHAVRDECGPQGIRAWRGHRAAMVRVVPFRLKGRVWCLRVPTGAFVAVRGGVAFPTGNSGFPKSHNLHGDWEGWGSALKPAWEPICVARKPLSEKTLAANVLKWGTGAINVDGCRIENAARRSKSGGMARKANPIYGTFSNKDVEPFMSTLGRWPANLIHDGSDEATALFSKFRGTGGISCNGLTPQWTDAGSAARFFYCAKANAKDRRGSKHPTVKPVSLIRYLARLITPPGGLILDPFGGSGTLAEAAMLEGFSYILMEREAEYCADIRRRIEEVQKEQWESLD